MSRNVEAAAPSVRRRVKEFKPGDLEDLEEAMCLGLSSRDLSPDQDEVFRAVMAWYGSEDDRRPILTVGGYAGSGKSTLTAVIAKALEERGRQTDRRVHIAFCAYTGKAANVLRQKLYAEGIRATIMGYPHYAGTIHSLLYKPSTNTTGEVLDWKRVDDLSTYNLIIVDEASMVDEQILEDLLSFGIPILAVGDHGQLPPVKGLGTLMEAPNLRLEKIHRQAEGNPIIALSKHVREMGDLPESWPDSENVHFLPFQDLQRTLEPLYQKVDPSEIAILTYTNRCRQSMNYQGRCMRNRREMQPVPEKGDQLICLRNMKGLIFNGMRGILETEPKDRGLWYEGRLYFPEEELEVNGTFLKAQMGREKTFNSFEDLERETGLFITSWGKAGMLFDYGYALTVHKSQGSQFKHVFVIYERPNHIQADEFRRWIYTAVTRASRHLYIVVG